MVIRCDNEDGGDFVIYGKIFGLRRINIWFMYRICFLFCIMFLGYIVIILFG